MRIWLHNDECPDIVVLLMSEIIRLPIPNETLPLFVGHVSFKNTRPLPLSLSIAVLGSSFGITISYGLGHLLRSRVPLTLRPWPPISPTHFLTAQRWISQWGKYE